MKILLLDIETAPNKVYVWGLWNQNVAISQIDEPGYVLCWAAKWLGHDEIHFDSVFKSSRKKMLKGIHKLLDQADAVIHYNGTKFDIPVLNGEFLTNGLPAPSPYTQIDLYKTVKAKFKFPSNKLDYVAQILKLKKQKIHNKGHALWKGCMDKDPESWEEMEKYNRGDVEVTEELYGYLKPWIKGHPSWSVYTGELVCPTCGSSHYHGRGYRYTSAGKYQRYQCQDCTHWFRGNKNLALGEKFISI